MIVAVDVPDPIAAQLHLDGEQGHRRALEMLALEGYRTGELSRGQASELLDMEFNETERFLKDHGCGLGLTSEEFERDARRLREFLARFSAEETSEIRDALAEAESESARGEGIGGEEMRRRFGLQ